MKRFGIDDRSRVGAELVLDRWIQPLVTITHRLDIDNDWRIEMTPERARKVARQLKRAADLLDPPKKRG